MGQLQTWTALDAETDEDLLGVHVWSGDHAVAVGKNGVCLRWDGCTFADKVLWTDRLQADDPRWFTLWLRENNRSAPTRLDEQLKKVEVVAQAVEEISGLAGFKVPARRAINLSAQHLKSFERDWLILRWSCPWSHVLSAARERLGRRGAAASSPRAATVLSARIVSAERRAGKPVVELTVLFVLQRLDRPLPAAVAR